MATPFLLRDSHAGCDGLCRSMAERSCPSPKVGAAIENARLRWHRSGLEELPHISGQGRQLRLATPCPRSGAAAKRSNPTSKERWLRGHRRAKRSYSTFNVRRGGCEEIPHIQGQRRSPSKMVGGVNSHLESNPIPTTEAQRAQTNLVHTRTQGPPHRLRRNCV